MLYSDRGGLHHERDLGRAAHETAIQISSFHKQSGE